MIRELKILLVALVALWGALGAFGNLSHLGGTYEAVRAVAAMEGVGEPGAANPQAIRAPFVVWLGVASIIAGKVGAAVFCALGGLAMIRARGGDASAFQRAKRAGVLGCGIAVAMLFGGWVVMAETHFLMWQTPMGEVAAPAAFRYGGFIALIMIFVAQPEP